MLSQDDQQLDRSADSRDFGERVQTVPLVSSRSVASGPACPGLTLKDEVAQQLKTEMRIDVNQWRGPIFKLAKDSVYGVGSFLKPGSPEKRRLQDCINQLRFVGGALEYRGNLPNVNLMHFESLMNTAIVRHVFATEVGRDLLQTALVNEFGPDMIR